MDTFQRHLVSFESITGGQKALEAKAYREFDRIVELGRMFSGLLGLLIFLLAAMESPFRGEIGVGLEAFKLVYEQLMKPGK